jgi:cell wall-associated NlpC family hydrolase
MNMTQQRILVLALVPALAGLLLACGAGGMVTLRSPRWACPSPTPRPYGEAGPIKEIITHTRPITAGGDWEEFIYYEKWEQEYGSLGGPPFPSPTPYALLGTSYVFGQRIELWPVHVQVSARSGPVVDVPGVPANTQQLYFIDITWHNHALEPFAILYSQHVRLRAITNPAGAVVSDGRWGMSAQSLRIAGVEAPENVVPPGVSQVSIPVIGPRGEPEIVDIDFVGNPDYVPLLPTSTTLAGTPTSTPAAAVPTPTTVSNDELRQQGQSVLTVQWSNAIWKAPGAGQCSDPGALTDWSADPLQVWGEDVPVRGPAAPAGADRLIQIALNQVGKPYVWGAKGPERFDCSGLVTWSYAQIGIEIPQGTAGQWPRMRPVEAGTLKPGDLVFFAIEGRGIDHVGMLVGDLNGDGQWDMVHAASPKLGVRVDYNIFSSSYYASRIRGFRTAR